MGKGLNAKEKLFCSYYAATNNAREAAARAGYAVALERTGLRLLEKTEVVSEIKRLKEQRAERLSQAEEGLRRIAFGGISDCIKLMLEAQTADPRRLDELDLFSISEIKLPKNGGMEIKFYDRIKALQLLAELGQQESKNGAGAFYEALERGAEQLAEYPAAEV